MTPYELSVYANAYRDRTKKENEDKMMQAYLIAAWTSRWVWQKTIPSYDKLTNKNEPKKQMTAEEMLEKVKTLNESLGGTTF